MGIEIEELYRDLHAHPELSFQEHGTAAGIAAAHLQALGFTVHTGIGRSGPEPCAQPSHKPVLHRGKDERELCMPVNGSSAMEFILHQGS